MRLSSRSADSVAWVVGRPIAEDGVQDVDPAPGQRDQSLVVPLAGGAFALVKGSAGRVAGDSDEGGLVEDAFERFVACRGPLQVADLAGLLEHRGQARRGGELVRTGKPGDATGFGKELRGQGGPHPRHAEYEGPVRVAVEHLSDTRVDLLEPLLRGQRFGGQLADQVGGDPLARDHNVLSGGGACGGLGQRPNRRGLDVADLAQMGQQALHPGGADLPGGDVAGQQVQPKFAGHIHDPLQPRVDGREQIPQTGRSPGGVGDQVTAPADQQTQLDVEFTVGLDGPQISTHAHLIGDDTGVFGIAFALTAHGGAPGPVDRDAGHVDHSQVRLQQHRLQQRRDAAQHIDPDRGRAMRRLRLGDLPDQRADVGRSVVDPAAEQDLPTLSNRDHGPVEVFSHVDAHSDGHATPFSPVTAVQPPPAVHALQSDRSQCLISGQGEATRQGAKPPLPSRAASMKAIPAPSAHPDLLHESERARSQKGRAA